MEPTRSCRICCKNHPHHYIIFFTPQTFSHTTRLYHHYSPLYSRTRRFSNPSSTEVGQFFSPLPRSPMRTRNPPKNLKRKKPPLLLWSSPPSRKPPTRSCKSCWLGREQAGLSASDRFQTGFRPVSDQCQTSVISSPMHSPCHSPSSPPCTVHATMSCQICGVMSDAQKCHVADAQCHFRTCPQS